MSLGNQHTAALNLTFIRRKYVFLPLFALLTYSQVEEVRTLNLEESTRYKIRAAGIFCFVSSETKRYCFQFRGELFTK